MLKLSYNNICVCFRYDFDQDGEISREDIHLVLSHIPISVT